MATFPAITVLNARASIAAMSRSLRLSLLAGLIGIGSPYLATAVEASSELQEMLRGIDGMRRLPVRTSQEINRLGLRRLRPVFGHMHPGKALPGHYN
jgi:hypothetical protein